MRLFRVNFFLKSVLSFFFLPLLCVFLFADTMKNVFSHFLRQTPIGKNNA